MVRQVWLRFGQVLPGSAWRVKAGNDETIYDDKLHSIGDRVISRYDPKMGQRDAEIHTRAV